MPPGCCVLGKHPFRKEILGLSSQNLPVLGEGAADENMGGVSKLRPGRCPGHEVLCAEIFLYKRTRMVSQSWINTQSICASCGCSACFLITFLSFGKDFQITVRGILGICKNTPRSGIQQIFIHGENTGKECVTKKKRQNTKCLFSSSLENSQRIWVWKLRSAKIPFTEMYLVW